MSKKNILLLILMLFAIFVTWVFLINRGSASGIKTYEKDGKTYYEVEGIKYVTSEKETDYVVIDTSQGIMIAQLFPTGAPITVQNFKKLVSEGFYKDMIFHRVMKDFMIQTGDPTGTGYSGSGETIKGEFKENGVENTISHKRGVLSMARAGADPETEETMNSASSQFFIVHKDSPHLDGKYAAFGLLVHGYDVLDKIATTKTENDKPIVDQKLKSIKFIEIYRGE